MRERHADGKTDICRYCHLYQRDDDVKILLRKKWLRTSGNRYPQPQKIPEMDRSFVDHAGKRHWNTTGRVLMEKILYDLMDWAGIEELVYSEASDPGPAFRGNM